MLLLPTLFKDVCSLMISAIPTLWLWERHAFLVWLFGVLAQQQRPAALCNITGKSSHKDESFLLLDRSFSVAGSTAKDRFYNRKSATYKSYGSKFLARRTEAPDQPKCASPPSRSAGLQVQEADKKRFSTSQAPHSGPSKGLVCNELEVSSW